MYQLNSRLCVVAAINQELQKLRGKNLHFWSPSVSIFKQVPVQLISLFCAVEKSVWTMLGTQ